MCQAGEDRGLQVVGSKHRSTISGLLYHQQLGPAGEAPTYLPASVAFVVTFVDLSHYVMRDVMKNAACNKLLQRCDGGQDLHNIRPMEG